VSAAKRETADELERALTAITASFEGVRITPENEKEMGDAVERLLTRAGIHFGRECRLSGGKDRLDFAILGVAVELKMKGGLADLLRQIDRYLAHPDVRAVVVVSTLRRLSALPQMLRGKPIRCVYVGGF
jgi:hypothetical protein